MRREKERYYLAPSSPPNPRSLPPGGSTRLARACYQDVRACNETTPDSLLILTQLSEHAIAIAAVLSISP